ncbi:hypothetical protein VARIO8X_130107 [Burkholderiales bacterium 8X]|nr:hypothetical protein VARIO8X_130107 [Burkholderiales bacterium 8X]
MLRHRRRHHLSQLDAVGLGLDDFRLALRAGAGAGGRLAHRHHPDAPRQAMDGSPRQCLGRALSQHSAPGPDLSLVPRGAGDLSGDARLSALRAGGAGAGALYLGADRRAGALGHPGAAEGPALCGHGGGFHHAAVLPLRHPADGLPHHPAAAHQRVDEHLQELVGGVCGVDRRTHPVLPAGRRGNLAQHGNLHRRGAALHLLGHGDQPDHGLRREEDPGARLRRGRRHGRTLTWRISISVSTPGMSSPASS